MRFGRHFLVLHNRGEDINLIFGNGSGAKLSHVECVCVQLSE